VSHSVYNLVECLPPQYGGVSVHVDRLHKCLLRDGVNARLCTTSNVHSTCPNLRVCTGRYYPNYQWLVKEGLTLRTDIFHAHSSLGFALASLAMSFRAQGIVYTFHNQMIAEVIWPTLNWLDRRAMTALFHRPNFRAIAVSPRVQEQLIQLGAPEAKMRVIPAFIPPFLDEIDELSKELATFLTAHSPVLSIYGFRYSIKDGIDLYGFDMALVLLSHLTINYPMAGLILVIPGVKNAPESIAPLRRQAAALQLEQHVLFVTEGAEANVRIFAESDLYVRPTTTDGDAVAVREALFFGVPVVASDASFRPDGTVVFRNRNQIEFECAVTDVLADLPSYKKKLSAQKPEDNYPAIRTVYDELLDNAKRRRGKGA